MALQIYLHSIECLNETDEISASDEVYVLVTVANLRPLAGIPAPPNLQVFTYGIFEDVDDDDEHPIVVNGPAFWGMDGTPRDIEDPADVGIVVSLMEWDNGTPAQYAELLNARGLISLGASLADTDPRSRATRLTHDLSNVLDGVDVPIPFNFDDDHIQTKQLVLNQSDLVSFGYSERRMTFTGADGEYELVFRIYHRGWLHNVPSAGQVAVLPGTSPTSWYTTPENVQHIAYVGTDQQIHESFFFIGGNSGWLHNVPSAGQVLVLPGTSPTSWYTTPENVQHIAYVGTDQQIHEAFYFIGGNSGWLHNVPSAGQVLVLPGTSPTSWYTTPENVQHIAYVGTDQLIHECFYFIGGNSGWLHNVPAGQTLVLPGTSPTSWFTRADNVQHIAYVGVDQQIHESFYFIGGNSGWLHNVPSAGQIAVLPGTSPTSWTTPDNVQHIAYVGVDQQIHESFYIIGGNSGWLHNVPSAGQTLVLPGTSPTSWYSPRDNVQHIVYVGVDQQIHECFYFLGGEGGWLHNVPSAGQTLVLPGTSPTSWYTTPENVQHVAYVGTDQQIHESFYLIQ